MNYIKLMRPKHYIKNFLIFVPLIFGGLLYNKEILIRLIWGFVSFSLLTSVIYIINDIKDCEKDKLHETKKNRPIASGKVSVPKAIIFAMFIFTLALFCQYKAVGQVAHLSYLYILVYIIINIFYSFGLKNIPLLDVTILAIGFLIRVLYGAAISGIEVSNWLYLTIISGAFYLGLGKRRNELKKIGSSTRKVLKYYTQDFLDKNMYMCLSLSIVFYALWTVDPINVERTDNLLIWTVPIIILIFMKYSMNIEKDSSGDPTEVIFSDIILLSLIFVYCFVMFLIIYFI